MYEEMMLRSLHVQSMRAGELHAGHDPHLLFQASTVSALLDRSYEGDLTFAELAGHGDTGIGTLNGLDGEMIALDGTFFRADVNGDVTEIAPNVYTPFAVVTEFEPTISFETTGCMGLTRLSGLLDEGLPDETPAAIRIDGLFTSIRARSVPKQFPPYRSLEDVVADQNVFEIQETSGSLVGFRFPVYVEGIELAGYHFHYIDDARDRGGHVLDLEIARATVKAALFSDLHVELPPGMHLTSPELAADTHAVIERMKNSGLE